MRYSESEEFRKIVGERIRRRLFYFIMSTIVSILCALYFVSTGGWGTARFLAGVAFLLIALLLASGAVHMMRIAHTWRPVEMDTKRILWGRREVRWADVEEVVVEYLDVGGGITVNLKIRHPEGTVTLSRDYREDLDRAWRVVRVAAGEHGIPVRRKRIR
jgi:hypothetical protein